MNRFAIFCGAASAAGLLALAAVAQETTTAPPAGAKPPPECNEPQSCGMTWQVRRDDHATGTTDYSCSPTPGAWCNAYKGDTSCKKSQPLLCFKPLPGSRRPTSLGPDNGYNNWASGIAHTTRSIQGSSIRTIADANAICAREFGDGWRVAEHHDGAQVAGSPGPGGWGFRSYGGSGAPNHRAWVHINDQPANCWAGS